MCDSAWLKSGLRVLVVDGHADSIALLMLLFKDYGIETIAASSASESLEIMQQACPDLLISEIILPDENGYSLMRKVKAFESAYNVKIPAIAVTTCASSADRLQALAAGFCRHLSKPLNLDELMATVAGVLEQTQLKAASACI